MRDLAGLYYASPASPPTEKNIIRMIDLSLAYADGHTARRDRVVGGGMDPHQAGQRTGYWFFAMEGRLLPPEFEGEEEFVEPYEMTNTDRFGFVAAPSAYPGEGKQILIIDETGRLFGIDPGEKPYVEKPREGGETNDRVLAPNYRSFPDSPAAKGWKLAK